MIRICAAYSEAELSLVLRQLKIKHLEGADGAIIPLLDECCVNECFTRNEIVRAARERPAVDDRHRQSRFGSLAPDSFARPKKRTHNSSLELLGAGNDIHDHGNGIISPATKRQKIDLKEIEREIDPDVPLQSREKDVALNQGSQPLNAPHESSSYVIADSQQSPDRTRKLHPTHVQPL